jgi:hypothetical protein
MRKYVEWFQICVAWEHIPKIIHLFLWKNLSWIMQGLLKRTPDITRSLTLNNYRHGDGTNMMVKVKVKQSHYLPGNILKVPKVWGSQISRQSSHESGKVISPTHRPPLPPRNISGTHFCYRLSQPHSHSAAGRIISVKNSNDTVGNRSCDLSGCSAVPQPTALPAACPEHVMNSFKMHSFWVSRNDLINIIQRAIFILILSSKIQYSKLQAFNSTAPVKVKNYYYCNTNITAYIPNKTACWLLNL